MYSDYKLIIHEQRAHNRFIFELQWLTDKGNLITVENRSQSYCVYNTLFFENLIL